MKIEQMILESPDLVIVPGPYLFCVKCRGRRGVVPGTQMANTIERAFKHFFMYQ